MPCRHRDFIFFTFPMPKRQFISPISGARAEGFFKIHIPYALSPTKAPFLSSFSIGILLFQHSLCFASAHIACSSLNRHRELLNRRTSSAATPLFIHSQPLFQYFILHRAEILKKSARSAFQHRLASVFFPLHPANTETKRQKRFKSPFHLSISTVRKPKY